MSLLLLIHWSLASCLCTHLPFSLKISGYFWKLTLIMNSSSIQSSASMTLSCHQLDLIWSAPSPATWSDDAASRRWAGTCPFRNSLIKAVIRPNPRLPNELLGEAGVPSRSGGWDILIHASAQRAGRPPAQGNCEDLFQTYYQGSKMHLEPQHAFRSGIINYFIINIHQSQRPDVRQVKDTDDWLVGGPLRWFWLDIKMNWSELN